MGAHSTPRGETSTATANGMRETLPKYDGKHRKDDTIRGFRLGNRDTKAVKASDESYERTEN